VKFIEPQHDAAVLLCLNSDISSLLLLSNSVPCLNFQSIYGAITLLQAMEMACFVGIKALWCTRYR
jgi:hypothetical protein